MKRRAEGVSVFYGYSQSVTFDYDYKWEEVFFARLRAAVNREILER